MMKIYALFVLGLLLLAGQKTFGQESRLGYQTVLTSGDGSLLAADVVAAYDVVVRIWDSKTETTPEGLLWEEKQLNPISVFEGRLALILGAGQSLPVVDGGVNRRPDLASVFSGTDARFVELTLTSAGGVSTTFSPRQRMVSSATALRAKVADTVAAKSIRAEAWAPGSLGAAQLGDESITGDNFAPGAVNGTHFIDQFVTSDLVEEGGIVSEDLAPGLIDTSMLAGRIFGTDWLADSSLNSNHVNNGALTGADLAEASLNTSHVIDGSIPPVKLAGDLGKVTLLNSTQIREVAAPAGGVPPLRSGERILTVNPALHSLPTSGVNGLVVKVFALRRGDLSGTNALVTVATWASDYQFPFNLSASQAMGRTVRGGAQSGDEEYEVFTMHVPARKNVNGTYSVGFYHADPSDFTGSGASRRWEGKDLATRVSVIGYY